jgi:hypothetical protein
MRGVALGSISREGPAPPRAALEAGVVSLRIVAYTDDERHTLRIADLTIIDS